MFVQYNVLRDFYGGIAEGIKNVYESLVGRDYDSSMILATNRGRLERNTFSEKKGEPQKPKKPKKPWKGNPKKKKKKGGRRGQR